MDTLVSPSGNVATTTPTYTWNAVAGAASYELLVQNTAGVALDLTVSATAAGCASGPGMCSIAEGSRSTRLESSNFRSVVAAANDGFRVPR